MSSYLSIASVLTLLGIMAGCTTTVNPGDASAPSLHLKYKDADTRNGAFGSDTVDLQVETGNYLETYVNAVGRDDESGIGKIELTIDAEVACTGMFAGRGAVQWSSRARWTERKENPSSPGTTDYVSSNVVIDLSPEKFAREANCYNNPTYGETSRVHVNVLNARVISRVCNNARPASHCTTQNAEFILKGEDGISLGG